MDVGVYEAKSRLSELIKRVRRGAEVVLTHYGEPVAKIIPIKPAQQEDRQALIREIRALRRHLNIRTRIPLRKLIDEGRD